MTDTPDNQASADKTPAKEKKAKAVKTPKATDTAPAAEASKTAPVAETKSPQSETSEAGSKTLSKGAEATAPKGKTPSATAKKSEKGEKNSTADSKTETPVDAAAPKKLETAADLLGNDIGELKIRRAKGSKNVTTGICHVLATFNNTLITFTDKAGNVIARSSSGKCGFKGAKKSTAYAATMVCQDAAKGAMAHGLKEVEIRLCGPGMGRDAAVRAIQTLGLGVSSLIDVTPIPHNGCRARKRRRV